MPPMTHCAGILLSFRFYLYFRCMNVLCTRVYVHHVCVTGAFGEGQKRVLDLLGLRLQTAANCHVLRGKSGPRV